MSWRPACMSTSTPGPRARRRAGRESGGRRRAGPAPPCGLHRRRPDPARPPGPGRAAPGSAARRRTPCRWRPARGRRPARQALRSSGALPPPYSGTCHSRHSAARGECGLRGAAAPAQAPPERGDRPLGQGRPIRALRIGSPRARVKLLVVGSVHGNEPAGKAVIARLRRTRPPRGTAIWLIEDANPDGAAANARHNAMGWTSTATSPTAGSRRTASTSPGPGRRPSPRPRRSSASSSGSGRASRSGTTRRCRSS